MRSRVTLVVLGWALLVDLLSVLNMACVPDELAMGLIGGAVSGTIGTLVALALGALHRRVSLPRSPGRLGAFAARSSLLGAIAWLVLDESVDWLIEGPFESGGLVPYLIGQLMLYFFILAAFHGVALTRREIVRSARAEQLAQAARLDALRYQLNPHFLFNVLNSVIEMIDEAPDRAQIMLRRLSSLLRDTLRDSTSTTLEKELGIVGRYLDIEAVRFEEKLCFDEDIAEGARACVIPPLLLHGLVENAVKHGMRSSPMPLRVWLKARRDADALRIEVRNTGRLDAHTDGVGLTNMMRRLETLYPGSHRFVLDQADGVVRALVEIRRPEDAA